METKNDQMHKRMALAKEGLKKAYEERQLSQNHPHVLVFGSRVLHEFSTFEEAHKFAKKSHLALLHFDVTEFFK